MASKKRSEQMKQLMEIGRSEEVQSLAKAYLLQRAFAEITRERVDEIWNVVLTENPIYPDPEGTRVKRYPECKDERISNHKDLYQASDSDFETVYKIAESELRKDGIKPVDMKYEHCPALVAESDLTDIEHAIIDKFLPPLGLKFDSLFLNGDGTKTYKKFLELCIGAIVSDSTFEAPELPK